MRTIILFLVPIFLLHLFVSIVQSSIEIDATSVASRVIDGDTFDISSGDRIRLADVNAPESGESGYSAAKNFLVSLVYQKTVYLDIDDVYRTDKYGRLVCVVYVDYNTTHFENVNKALLVVGYATVWNFNNEFNPYLWTLYVAKNQTPMIPWNVTQIDTDENFDTGQFYIILIIIVAITVTAVRAVYRRRKMHR